MIVLLGVVTIVFILFNVMPSDPAKMMLGDRDNAKQLQLINAKYYFNEPLYKQYLYYLNDLSPISFHIQQPSYKSYVTLISLNNGTIIFKKPYFRDSFYQKNISVSSLIVSAMPNTIVLAISAISFALFLAFH